MSPEDQVEAEIQALIAQEMISQRTLFIFAGSVVALFIIVIGILLYMATSL